MTVITWFCTKFDLLNGKAFLVSTFLGIFLQQKWSYKIFFQVKAFKVDGQDSFTAEMHLALHDARELPIGWSSWQPKFGNFKVILPHLPNFGFFRDRNLFW